MGVEVAIHSSLLTPHYSLLTPQYLLLATYSSILTTRYLLLATYSSLLTPHNLLLATYYSLLTTHYLLFATLCSAPAASEGSAFVTTRKVRNGVDLMQQVVSGERKGNMSKSGRTVSVWHGSDYWTRAGSAPRQR